EPRITSSAAASSTHSTRATLATASLGHRRSVPLPSAEMDARAFLATLASFEGTEDCLAHIETLPAKDPVLEPFPEGLPEVLRQRLHLLGIEGVYPHQRRALQVLEDGDHLVMATGTASGKTLVYNLAFAGGVVGDDKRTALYLFPTKA